MNDAAARFDAFTTHRRISHDADILYDAFTTIRAEHLVSGKPASSLLDSLTADGPGELDRLGWGDRGRSKSSFNAAVRQARDRLMDEVYSAVHPGIRPKPPAVRKLICAMVGDHGVSTAAKSRRLLTHAEVRFIRREYTPGRGSPTNGYALAKLFGVNPGLVHQIASGMIYRDVPDERY